MTDDTKKVHRGAGRVAFLARLADFQRLLDAGHPMRAIYDDHRNQLGIGYPQFTKYVGRYVRKADHDRHQTRSGQGEAAAPQTTPTPAPSSGGTPSPASPNPSAAGPGQQPARPAKPKGGFSHNPNSGNDRNDLI